MSYRLPGRASFTCVRMQGEIILQCFFLLELQFLCKLRSIKSMSDSPDFQTSKDSPQESPVCKPTKWFLWRAIAMLVMFSVFAVLFLQDGIWGYRDKNLQFFVHANFKKAGIEFQQMDGEDSEGEFSEEKWETHAVAQKCQFPDDAEAIMPKDANLAMPWPESLVNGYAVMDEKGGQNGAIKLWEEYAKSRKWDAEPAEHPMEAHKIREQFIAAGVAGLLIAVTLFFLIRTMRRSIKADDEALYTQDGRRIAYSDMVRIDKRKWDTKGLALVYFSDGGDEKKAKIDGMVYGQFKAEDGAPAERLFAYVMDRFKGEVIEYIEEEEEAENENSKDEAENN